MDLNYDQYGRLNHEKLPPAGTMTTIDYNKYTHGPLGGALNLNIDPLSHPLHSKRRPLNMEVGDINSGEKVSYLEKLK